MILPMTGQSADTFVVSLENFAIQARGARWGFWRGYLLGTISMAAISYPMMKFLAG